MNPSEARELLISFSRKPSEYEVELGRRLPELLEAVREAPDLASLLDNAPINAVHLWGTLAESEPLSKFDDALVDRALSVDETDQDEVRQLVSDMLLEGAPTSERERVSELDPWLLFRATEAISSLVRRACKLEAKAMSCTWANDGSICLSSGKTVLSLDALVIEVARFTELWSNLGTNHLVPSPRARDLVLWVRGAIERFPRLLRHFEAGQRGSLVLKLLDSKSWSADLAVRWVPEIVLPLDSIAGTVAVGVVDPPGVGAYLVELDPERLGEDSIDSFGQRLGVEFTAVFLTRKSTFDYYATAMKGAPASDDDHAPGSVQTLGIRVDSVEFLEDGFEFTIGGERRLIHAERIPGSGSSGRKLK